MNPLVPLSSPPQACLGASKKRGALVRAAKASSEDRKHTWDVHRSVVCQYTAGTEYLAIPLRYLCPHPVLVSDAFMADLANFHHALALALTNIVQRWFTDKEAAFTTRMPLQYHEEELLQV